VTATGEALIFDCDGTLADTMPAHYRAWQAALGPHQLTFPEDRFYALGGMPTEKIIRLLAGEAARAVDVAAIARAKDAAFLGSLDAVVAIEQVVAVARAARGRLPMAVASGGFRRTVELTLRQIGIFDWFDAVVAFEDVTRHKPEPDTFLEAARRLGVPAAACTVYEDTDLGIESARRAGMRFVDVRTILTSG
jgi:HAD superfamily hydrolase (TIGR01509 family)